MPSVPWQSAERTTSSVDRTMQHKMPPCSILSSVAARCTISIQGNGWPAPLSGYLIIAYKNSKSFCPDIKNRTAYDQRTGKGKGKTAIGNNGGLLRSETQ